MIVKMKLRTILGALGGAALAATVAYAATTTLTLGTSGGPGGVVVLQGSTSGSVTLQPPAVAGATTITLPTTPASTKCLHEDNTGVISAAANDCGTGGGGTIASTTSALAGDGAGNAVAVTGTGTNCVLVNGSSGACGGGGATGSGVDGGTSAQSLTAGATLAAGTRLVKIASGWATGTIVLPAISAVSADTAIAFDDGGTFIDGTHTLTIQPNAADSILGGSVGVALPAITKTGGGIILRVSATHNWNIEANNAFALTGGAGINISSTAAAVTVTPAGRTAVGDANCGALTNASYLEAFHVVLTAGRSCTLPAASTMLAGQHLKFADEGTGPSGSPANSPAINGAFTVTINRAGSDTIAGATSIVMSFGYCAVDLVSDGSANWGVASNSCSAVPVTQGGTGLSAGTSGGIPYYSASTTMASSAALTANLPVIGGGAGAAPTVGTRSGNTTAYVTTTGAQTSGDCVKIDANGNHVANGSACGGGGGGSGLFNQVLSATPTSASTGLSTWLDQGSCTVTDGTTGVVVDCPSAAGQRLQGRCKTAAATPSSYTILLAANTDASTTGFNAGWFGYYDGTKLQVFRLANGNTAGQYNITVDQWANNTTYSTSVKTSGIGFPGRAWLKVRDDGTNIHYAVSSDGANFIDMYSAARAAYLSAPTNVCYGADGVNAETQATVMSYAAGS
jgi:hypothetical protein